MSRILDDVPMVKSLISSVISAMIRLNYFLLYGHESASIYLHNVVLLGPGGYRCTYHSKVCK